jgi:uncharacterized DUF497 family protein
MYPWVTFYNDSYKRLFFGQVFTAKRWWQRKQTNLLIVCHCEKDAGNTIRIISARKATKNERKHYHRDH